MKKLIIMLLLGAFLGICMTVYLREESADAAVGLGWTKANGLGIGTRMNGWNRFQVHPTTGALVAIGTATTGNLWQIDATDLTSGNALRINCDNDYLTTGAYINLLGGIAGGVSRWKVAEDGAQTISSIVATTQSLSITNN